MQSNELYIADAYNGLFVVGPNGGTPSRLISTLDDDDEEEEEGPPFTFSNGLDVDQRTGTVYFTTSSSKYQRRYSYHISYYKISKNKFYSILSTKLDPMLRIQN